MAPQNNTKKRVGARVADVAQDYPRYEMIKSVDAVGIPCFIVGCRGPFLNHSSKKENDYYLVLTLEFMDGVKNNMFLSYQQEGQRAKILEFFQQNPAKEIGPVVLVQETLPNENMFYKFIDCDEEGNIISQTD